MRTLLLVGTLLMAAHTAHAGAWTRDQGHFYLNLNYGLISGSSIYNAKFGKTQLLNKYTQHTLGVYAEVGVIDRWLTLVLDWTALRANVLANQGRVLGVSDMRIGAWTGVVTKPLRFSIGLFVGIPSGASKPKGYDPATNAIAATLPLGDGETDIEPKVALGYSFGGWRYWPLRHYVQLELGYWIRTKAIRDGFTYKFELGTQFPWKVINRFWFLFRIHGVESFASSADAGQSPVGLGNGVTYTSWGLELYARVFKGLGLSYGVDGAFRARSVIAAASHRFSVSYQW